MKKILLLCILISCGTVMAQSPQTNTQVFWNNLQSICGKAFTGEVLEAPEDDPFRESELIMHVRSCEEDRIRIPFFVGDDRSRTWVLTLEDDRIQLKHDHRHSDGSEDDITQYGGKTTNSGLSTLQMFAADEQTAELIPAAASNIWWIELEPGEYFTYNLRRIGTDRYFSVRFNFGNEIPAPEAPWGWEE